MPVQSVSELLSKVNYVATRLRHLETIRWHVEWKLPPNELSPKIVLIYALLLLKCRESYLRAFLIHNLNFARLFARLMPVFLLKERPSFARLFTKMSPSEELVTLLLMNLSFFKATEGLQKQKQELWEAAKICFATKISFGSKILRQEPSQECIP